jgi:hypothetical protein
MNQEAMISLEDYNVIWLTKKQRDSLFELFRRDFPSW